MGATHTINHREDIVQQIQNLKLSTPIKYIFITHTPSDNIVQTKEIPMYGTEWMAKSLTFVWALIGTKPYYKVQLDSHGQILKQLAKWLDEGTAKCHFKQSLPLTLEGVRKEHEPIENGGVMGKLALDVDVEGRGEDQTFM